MIESIINCITPTEADALLLLARYDRSASLLKGARHGPRAILKCLHQDVEFFDRVTKSVPRDLGKIASTDLGRLNHLRPDQMVERVAAAYVRFSAPGRLLVLLGGEHSVSIGAFRAIACAEPASDITILQIDAHCDLRDDDSNANPDDSCPSRFAHSCVMRRAHEMGFRLVQVGIRSYAKEELDYFTAHRIPVFQWSKRIPSVEEIVRSIRTRKIYLSLDVDGLDPTHMPATGAPVPGGLEWYYTLSLIQNLIARKTLAGADIVEVAPRKSEVLTQFGAASICQTIIACQFAKRWKHKRCP